jgi:hypothetical protein
VDKYIEKRDAQRKVRKELEDKRMELLRIQQEERIAEYRRRQQVAREEEHQRILAADTKV